jgi:NADPH-ferrihemoprotein reductase
MLLSQRPNKYDAKNPFYAKVEVCRELITPVKDEGELNRHCIHMEVDISGSGLHYASGDHIAVWPENDEKEVLRLADVLGLLEEVEVPVVDGKGQEIDKKRVQKLDLLVTVHSADGNLSACEPHAILS